MSYVTPYISPQVQSSWGEETTYKTRATNINQFVRILDQEIPLPEVETEVVHAPGGGRKPHYVNDYKKWNMEGSMSLEIFKGEFLGAVLGTVVTTGSDPYTHTYTVTDLQLPSFSMQHALKKSGTDSLIFEFLGCKVSQCNLKMSEENEKLIADINYLPTIVQDGGTTYETVTPVTSEPFIFKKGSFSSTSLYAGAKARVHDFELGINNNLKPNYASGYNYYPYDIVEGKTLFDDMKVTIGLEDDTEWDELIGDPGTSHDFSYVFTRGANDTLTISGSAKMKSMPLDIGENDIRATLTLVPSTVTIVIVDSNATYAFE